MSNIKKVLSIFIFTFLFIFLVSCRENVKEESNAFNNGNNITNSLQEEKYYTVTFKDEDGTVLKSELYKEGTMPSYNGFPTKANDSEYKYTFSGWEPSITVVCSDVIYNATYTREKNVFTYSFYEEDGETLITSDKAQKGDVIVPPSDCSKESDAEYTYQFDGWYSNGTKVTDFTINDDISFVATFKNIKNKYTVTWKNYDGNVLEVDSVEYGLLPTYDGKTPLKSEDDNNIYVFKGWDKKNIKCDRQCNIYCYI